MKIKNCSMQNYTPKTPSFSAIHPVKIYIKMGENSYVRTDDVLIVQPLQKRIVKYLNNWRDHSAPKNQEQINLRHFLFNDFLKEKDYIHSGGRISGFCDSNLDGHTKSYILTGDQVNITSQARAQIVEANHNLKLNPSSQARQEVAMAKRGYFEKVKNVIRNRLHMNFQKDTDLNLYFEPYKAGKETKYRFLFSEFIPN